MCDKSERASFRTISGRYWHYLAIDGRFVRAGWYAKRCPGLAERLSERPMGDILDSASQESNQIWEYGMVGWQEHVPYAL